ncbi:MAG: sigma-70 family RNA polymerase sigma factor [Azospirillaceae bacterium]|nr:sigma-70 family RNA polymerase sigma factor [Azospirillaceae bacterium]
MSNLGSDLDVQIASLRRYSRALVRERADADDLVQETLARAVAHADQFKQGTNLRAWLFTIMHNVHVNQVRQKASRPGDVPVEDVELLLVSPARQEMQVELRDVARIIDTLPEEQRQVLLLVTLEGLKYDEVATMLGVPIGTVMSRLSRARESIRLKMGDQGGASLRRVK